ncbi:MAG: SIS domain-containing protein [Alphaproteobacteria bacterium]|nr:SIS domain-containing protein [Alphaproteobacteria bacterium]
MVEQKDHSKWIARARESFQDSIAVKQKVIENHVNSLIHISEMIAHSISEGGKLFLCGNGGSAADAQHLAAELLVRLRPHVNRQSLPALCLATDMSTVTACGNDYSFEDLFARPLAGLGKRGDVLLGITTSGKSPNVIKAFLQAKEMNIKTIGFLGSDGGPALKHCDASFVVPSHVTARVQEAHITAGHVVMEFIEDMLTESNYLTPI